jgi:hypothetical protein
MDNKEVIIEVIKQDMRYNQYITALRRLGIEVYEFELDFVTIVLKLLKLEECPDSWLELYVGFISRSEDYEISPSGTNLYQLAEECYCALKEFDLNNLVLNE